MSSRLRRLLALTEESSSPVGPPALDVIGIANTTVANNNTAGFRTVVLSKDNLSQLGTGIIIPDTQRRGLSAGIALSDDGIWFARSGDTSNLTQGSLHKYNPSTGIYDLHFLFPPANGGSATATQGLIAFSHDGLFLVVASNVTASRYNVWKFDGSTYNLVASLSNSSTSGHALVWLKNEINYTFAIIDSSYTAGVTFYTIDAFTNAITSSQLALNTLQLTGGSTMARMPAITDGTGNKVEYVFYVCRFGSIAMDQGISVFKVVTAPNGVVTKTSLPTLINGQPTATRGIAKLYIKKDPVTGDIYVYYTGKTSTSGYTIARVKFDVTTETLETPQMLLSGSSATAKAFFVNTKSNKDYLFYGGSAAAATCTAQTYDFSTGNMVYVADGINGTQITPKVVFGVNYEMNLVSYPSGLYS